MNCDAFCLKQGAEIVTIQSDLVSQQKGAANEDTRSSLDQRPASGKRYAVTSKPGTANIPAKITPGGRRREKKAPPVEVLLKKADVPTVFGMDIVVSFDAVKQQRQLDTL
jgi:hypothetical protein